MVWKLSHRGQPREGCFSCGGTDHIRRDCEWSNRRGGRKSFGVLSYAEAADVTRRIQEEEESKRREEERRRL